MESRALGAQVVAFGDLLWRSPIAREPLRAGIPICFPWFGARDGLPSHGFARTATWEVVPTGPPWTAGYLLRDSEETRRLWPHPFVASVTVVGGETLTVTLEVANPGTAPFTFEAALHTYLAVGDVTRVRLRGLAGARYLDKTEGSREAIRGPDPWVLDRETDAVHLDTAAAVTVEDPARGRTIRVEKEGSRSTVVWNPWATRAATMPDVGEGWRSFVCVEAANVGEDAVTLLPGGAHRLVQRLSLDP